MDIDPDIEPLVRRKGDVGMPDDPEVMDVVRQIDQACREIGFFYVVCNLNDYCFEYVGLKANLIAMSLYLFITCLPPVITC